MNSEHWEQYLAESLAPMLRIGATTKQKFEAEMETGRCILMMQEWMDQVDWHYLLQARGINQAMASSYISTYRSSVAKHIKSQDKQL